MISALLGLACAAILGLVIGVATGNVGLAFAVAGALGLLLSGGGVAAGRGQRR